MTRPTYHATIVRGDDEEINEYSQGHLDSLILAVEFLRKHGRTLTVDDLVDLLRRLGGPNMPDAISERHQGLP